MQDKKQRPYAPAPYRASEDAARRMIWQSPFALIVSPGAGDLVEATHTPLYFADGSPECSCLIGHIARVNSQAASLTQPGSALAVFSGPSAYVSPRWYVEDEDVPTWIYQSVHVRGQIEPVPEGAEMLALMENIISQSETRIGGGWELSRIRRSDVDRMMRRIIGFRLHIETISGVSKLEQTRSAANRAAVADELERGTEPDRFRLAKLLREV